MSNPAGRPRTKGLPPVKIPATSKMKHGTVSVYTNLGCRCWRCKQANREYTYEYRARKQAEIAAGRIHDCPECRCGAA